MSYKHKKVFTALNYIENIVTLIFSVTGCISISAFASLVDIPSRIMRSTIGLIICAITVKSQ